VLVLGASGFIGSHVFSALKDAEYRVAGTSTSGEGTDFACDLRDPESIEVVLRAASPGAIVAAAGISSVKEAWDDPEATLAVNTRGYFNLLEAIRQLAPDAHLTVASSASVYGPPASSVSLPFTEDSALNPASPYGASKAATEVLCHQYERQYGLQVAVIRLFNQVGPGQSDVHAPAEFARRIAVAEKQGEKGWMVPMGNPESRRDFTDVRDSAQALVSIVDERLVGTYNLCSGQSNSLREILAGIVMATKVEVGIQLKPERSHPADISELYGSGKKLFDAIGWQASTPLDESLADLLEDFRGRV